MPRTILHFDLDAFFCSVEEILDPSLAGRPFAVAGRPDQRGVVASASYAARPFGVRSAMPTSRAVRLCPELILVHPRHGLYGEYSEKVMTLVRDAAPVVEQVSIDEAFLDVSDDPRPGEQVAARLQAEILERYSLPTSWGVATNRLVAKIATEVGKPRGLVVVPPGGEAAFLAPLPVGMLWGVGPKTRLMLEQASVTSIGDLAALGRQDLARLFGEHGLELASRARGEDSQPVVESYEPKSMSSETTFPKDVRQERALRSTLLALAEDVGERLREAGLAGSTVRLKLRWSDFTTITRQTRLAQPTSQDKEIYAAADLLFKAAWPTGRAVRLLGVGVSQLGQQVRQLDLFDSSWQADERLMKAVDAIRERYGHQALQRAAQLRNTRRRAGRGGSER